MTEVEGFEFPETLHYNVARYIWADYDRNLVRVGFTDYGQQLAGRILFIRFRRLGTRVALGRPVATIESAKWVGRVAAPVAGKIIEVNSKVEEQPDLINNSPYSKGWLVRIKPEDVQRDLRKLLRGERAIEAFRKEIAKTKVRKQRF